MTRENDVRARLEGVGIPGRWRGRPPAAFSGLVTDSRRATSGDLFCAVRGVEADGHRFVGDAAARGAAGAVVEEAQPEEDLPQLVVEDTRIAAAHLAALFSGDPGREVRLVGVTGTNGKTTTAWITRHLLGARWPAAALGTLGVVDAGGRVHAGELTTPGPVELMRTLRRLRDDGVEAVAVEASSHALDQHRVDGLPFDVAVFVAFGRDHLDYHADPEAYLAAKLRLAGLVVAEGTVAANADEPAWRDASFAGRRVLRFGFGADADVRATELRPDRDGCRFRLEAPGGSVQVRLPLLGEVNVQNALGAATGALALGVPVAEVRERLGTVPQVPGRFELLRDRHPVVVRDYAHTPDAMERALETLRPGVGGRILLVFGCGGDRDPGKRPLMGRVAARLADRIVVTSDNPRSEDPGAIAAAAAAPIPADRHEVILDRREAIARAMEIAAPGDLVLLLGKGHETHQELRGRRIPFDEAVVVRELARERGLEPAVPASARRRETPEGGP